MVISNLKIGTSYFFTPLEEFAKENIRYPEDKANAHAGMPFCGISRFVVLVSCWCGQQPFWGVGRLCLSVTGNAEPRLGKCNDSRLFCILTKFGEVLCITERTPRKLTKELI